MKYIVYWALYHTSLISCPDVPVADKFGRVPSTYISCSMAHFKTEFVGNKRKEFNTRDSAFSFYREALEQSKLFFHADIKDVKIDSTEFKKK